MGDPNNPDSHTTTVPKAEPDAETDLLAAAHHDSTSPHDDSFHEHSPGDHAAEPPMPQGQQPPGALPGMHIHPAGASVYTPNSAPAANALNPRSCVTCRRRKVRCDKRMPCSNCRRAQITCIFPAPGRAPRRPRPKDPNAPPKQPSTEREIELMKRLRKLEGIVEELSGQIEIEATKHPSNDNSPESVPTSTAGAHGTRHGGDKDATNGSGVPRAYSVGTASTHSGGSHGSGGSMVDHPREGDSPNVNALLRGFGPLRKSPPVDVRKQFGRMVLGNHGSTRYVSSAFWSKITDEV